MRLSVKFLLIPVAVLALAGCNYSSAENDTKQQVNAQQDIYNKAQPIPQYDYSNERAALIAIYNARTVGNVSTWTVFMSYSGTPQMVCASKGFPIPYSTELTNPQQIVRQNTGSNNWDPGVVAQADPNGLFPGASSSATWVLCLNSDGSTSPVYWEPPVASFTYAVSISNGQIVPIGSTDGSVKITQKNGSATAAPTK